MELQLKQSTENKANQNQELWAELSPKEQAVITGGGWLNHLAYDLLLNMPASTIEKLDINPQ